jgi:ABC-2 type transport system ATP-binding protein/lipopolysaccharide transport system ATP-binding protein
VVRGRTPKAREFWALRDATFAIERGSTFGLVGHNGSGKSTTLKVLAGIYRPTSGTVVVNGRVSALLELGAGFHGELTGRENIRLNGAILGMTRRQIDAAMPRIIEFSGIEEFIDSPVKVYSSGMFVRLGFSIAVTLDPEILIVDEIIAVGDEEFQRKCFDHLFELRKRGTTIILVSHALGLVKELCDRAIWLDHGVVRELGPARDVVDAYMASVNARELDAQAPVGGAPVDVDEVRPGSGEVRVTRMEFLDAGGRAAQILISGEPCVFRIHYRASEPVARASFAIGFKHESGVLVAGPTSNATPWALDAGTGYVDFTVSALPLGHATYRLSVAVADHGHSFDRADEAFELRVRAGADEDPGLTQMPGTWLAPVSTSPVADGIDAEGALVSRR